MSGPQDATHAQKSSRFSDLGPRVASAVALVAGAVATLLWGGDAFALFWMAAAFAVNWEWQGLVGGERRLARVVVGGGAVAAAAAFGRTELPAYGLLEIALLAPAAGLLAGQGKRLWAASGVVYAGALALSVCLLRESPHYGALAIGWLFAVVWGSDIFAYFGGRLIGGPKLWVRVSAGKTWSGTVVGAVSGALAGLLVVRIGVGPAEAGFGAFALGLVAAIVSQIGDLVESSIKRHFGVKDSSNLIPGHGGFMDRLDGFIVAAAFAAAVGVLRGAPDVASGLFLW